MASKLVNLLTINLLLIVVALLYLINAVLINEPENLKVRTEAFKERKNFMLGKLKSSNSSSAFINFSINFQVKYFRF